VVYLNAIQPVTGTSEYHQEMWRMRVQFLTVIKWILWFLRNVGIG